ncbi:MULTISPECIES: uridine kinase [Pseudobutyrivibrio]|uniref:Uridine kinase n=1 Tax=Pseudobutyrivibrio xylanivorans TaxID=185007 RepID=A0A1G5RSK7_PSEXY|nr:MULTISPECIES: uridine kinase [Pseudobutyrivibrio]MDC7278431.1 uridine kinase [Butyrivibrio fibrisolvens]SCZ76997.1 uridine kinase [Pseudobutyrivibrio xylanivorans]
MSEKICVLGVAGGSASGKTTIINKLQDFFGEDIAVISHDAYYKAHPEMSFEERSQLNYDHPDSFESDRMAEDVRKLIKGYAIDMPVYDYVNHNRSAETVRVEPKTVIVMEGILILENKELRDLMDIKIFVDTDADERLMRRIQRDMIERGRSIESIIEQYSKTVKPMHEEFVEPSKKHADIIIPRGGENAAGIEMLTTYMTKKLHSED